MRGASFSEFYTGASLSGEVRSTSDFGLCANYAITYVSGAWTVNPAAAALVDADAAWRGAGVLRNYQCAICRPGNVPR